MRRKHKRVEQRISLLVPLSTDDHFRMLTWEWLAHYWRHEIPDVEIVVGRDHHAEDRGRVFSKTTAVNDAASRATGDIFVILDADAYFPGDVILEAAARIRKAREIEIPLWFVPYRNIYRLNIDATFEVLESDPRCPLRFSSPPDDEDLEDAPTYAYPGHKYGAMVMVMPREAFEVVGGMDCRFRGWGGEDFSFLLALDTLFTPHRTLPGDVLHLWHPKFDAGDDPRGWKTRMWAGQEAPQANDRLAARYLKAYQDPVAMFFLTEEAVEHCYKTRRRWWWFVFTLLPS